MALKLCRKYIDDDSKMQVNISGEVRTRVLGELSVAPGRLVFEQAQEEVFVLMQAGRPQRSVLQR